MAQVNHGFDKKKKLSHPLEGLGWEKVENKVLLVDFIMLCFCDLVLIRMARPACALHGSGSSREAEPTGDRQTSQGIGLNDCANGNPWAGSLRRKIGSKSEPHRHRLKLFQERKEGGK